MDWVRHKHGRVVNHHTQLSVPLVGRIKAEMVSEVHSDYQHKNHNTDNALVFEERSYCEICKLPSTLFSGTVD
jgi:hypothetical protein